MKMLLLLITPPQRNKSAKPVIAQIEPSPDQKSKIDWEKNMGEQRIAGTHLAGNRTAKIASEQHGAQNRRTRNGIKNGANQQHYADWNNHARLKSQTNRAMDGGRKVQDLDAAIKEKKKQG